MRAIDLKNDKTIKDWLSGSNAKQATINSYTDSMKTYTNFLGKTPEQLLEESEEDILSGKLMRKRRIFDELREFKEYLEKLDLAPLSVKTRINAIRSFYTFYNIQLPSLPRSKTNITTLAENWEIPKKEDIQEAINVADTLEKALILTGVSSGLAINEISNLTLEEFFNGYDKESEITTLHLVREKVGYEFYTFLTPEASRSILEYLKYRERRPKKNDKDRKEAAIKRKITYNSRGKAIGYLFISKAISPEYLETEDEELRKISTITIQAIYAELSTKINKASPKGKRNLIRSHNMRKFFNSTLLANGADIFTTDFMMGHKIDPTKEAYFRADPKKLKEKYKNYIPFLTIQKELNISESQEYQKLKVENEVLARETAKATVERSEIQTLRNELEVLKEKKEKASDISKRFFIDALQDPDIQELLKNLSKT